MPHSFEVMVDIDPAMRDAFELELFTSAQLIAIEMGAGVFGISSAVLPTPTQEQQ